LATDGGLGPILLRHSSSQTLRRLFLSTHPHKDFVAFEQSMISGGTLREIVSVAITDLEVKFVSLRME
jgi:hypothetical protein